MAKKLPIGAACYACDEPATSWEHAPPKGFYPKGLRSYFRDKAPVDYRQCLIQVPSCDAHNNAKSQDDNYAMTITGIIAAALGGEFDRLHPHPFALELLDRLPHGRRLRATMIERPEPMLTSGGRYYKVSVERTSIDQVIDATARALYFHEHRGERRWPGQCHVHSHIWRSTDMAPGPQAREIELAASGVEELGRRGVPGYELKGPHPDVFAYQLVDMEPGRPIARLVFYGVFTFLAFADPVSGEPHHHGPR